MTIALEILALALAAGTPARRRPASPIRARPQRAIRFKRGAIIAIAAMGSASLMAVAWLALKPQVFRKVAQDSELSEPSVKPPGDALGKLPTSYGDAPRLGPPLPGDLGRPILRAQRSMASEGTLPPAPASTADVAAQQRAADLKAARESGLLVQVSHSQGPIAAGAAATDRAEPPLPAAMDASRVGDERGQQGKEAFVATLDRSGDANPHMLAPAASPYLVVAGSVIAASLVTGLNSDLPGMVVAQVTQNVYDSVSGTTLLIPQGSRLIGAYDSVVAFGQKRALVVWQRIIRPDGSSLRIDNMPATDSSGYAGLADKVDFHTWSLLKGIGLATLLGVGSELSIDGESDLVEAIRESTQRNVARAGDQLTSRNLDIQPTIMVRPGAPVRLVVHKDLVLTPWQAKE